MGKTRILGSQISLDSLTGAVHALTSKTTPADADEALLADSAASYAARRLTWSSIKSALRSYFDAIYSPSSGWIPAGETWTFGSASDPEFTFTVSGDRRDRYQPGDRIRLTQGGTVRYFIVTKVTYTSPITSVTVFGGTDYDLENAPITDPCYSRAKSPQGFPLDPERWSLSYISFDEFYEQSNMTPGQWYDTGISLSIPTGRWWVQYSVMISTADLMEVTLSTSPSSRSHPALSGFAACWDEFVHMAGSIALTSKATCHLLVRMPFSVSGERYLQMYASDDVPLVITAVSEYL